MFTFKSIEMMNLPLGGGTMGDGLTPRQRVGRLIRDRGRIPR
jgi:hypothetical protein